MKQGLLLTGLSLTVGALVLSFSGRDHEPMNGQDVRSVPARTVAFVELTNGQRVSLIRNPNDQLYRLTLKGTTSGLDSTDRLLLWMQPVDPSADGWYLQRGGLNGAPYFTPNGEWQGRVQLGNATYPPKEGHTFDVAVTVLSDREAAKVLSQTNTAAWPNPVGRTTAVCTGLIVQWVRD